MLTKTNKRLAALEAKVATLEAHLTRPERAAAEVKAAKLVQERDVFRDADAHPADTLQGDVGPLASASTGAGFLRRNAYEVVTQREVFEVAADKGWWNDCELPPWPPNTGKSYETPQKYRLDHRLVVKVIPEKLALIHSENSEAFEDLLADRMTTRLDCGGQKSTGFASEIADICIRVMDLAGALTSAAPAPSDVCSLDSEINAVGPAPLLQYGDTLDRCIARLHLLTSHALEDYRKGFIVTAHRQGERNGVHYRLALIIVACRELAARCAFDLNYEIAIKHAYNKTREFRHGGKKT